MLPSYRMTAILNQAWLQSKAKKVSPKYYSASGNASLFTKYVPKLAPSCNIVTCEQNGRDIKLGDTKQS